jgi:hypothetical protein
MVPLFLFPAEQPNNALEPTPVSAFSSAFAVDITSPAWLSLSRSLDLMPRCYLLIVVLFLAFAASGQAAHTFWTRLRVSNLTLDLVDDPTRDERLMFFPNGFVLVTLVTKRRVKDGEEQTTSQPALHWKISGDRVVIYWPPHSSDVEDTLTFVRREGSFLVVRRKSGAIARFKMSHEISK